MHIFVMPPVSKALGVILIERDQLLSVLNRLYDRLENHVDLYRGCRDPEDPDLFSYVTHILDGNKTWHTLVFSVDDRQATGYLIVVGVTDRRRRAM